MFKLIRSSILAGIAIGCGGYGFLASGIQSEAYGKLFGAVLFSFGLMTVVGYRLSLYTGTAGFIRKNEFGKLMVILLGNIAGCICMGLLTRFSPMDIQQAAQAIFEARVKMGPLTCGLLAVPCGFMMTTSVTFARKHHYLPLLLAVPLFIVCGFTHCIADAFTYSCVPVETLGAEFSGLIMIYLATVVGNFIGCNLFRIIVKEDNA